MTTYYFQTLPLRPPPHAGESLTSYLSRLLVNNRVTAMRGAHQLYFPDRALRNIRDLDDTPPLTIGLLAAAVHLPATRIYPLTFYHLVRKFNRATDPQTVSRFLGATLHPAARICPHCLADTGTRRLIHRFRAVSGCEVHGTALRARCLGCQRPLPLFRAPFDVRACPRCGRDLRTQLTRSLSPAALRQRTSRDLEYLLTAQSWETQAAPVIRAVGRLLSDHRQQQELSGQDAAAAVGITLSAIEGIEHGQIAQRGASLGDFLAYFHYFDLSFRRVFEQAAAVVQTPPASPDGWQLQQRIAHVERAIRQLQDEGTRISQTAICRQARIARETIQQFPDLKRRVEQAVRAYKQAQQAHAEQQDAQLVMRVNTAIDVLAAQGKRPSIRQVAAWLDMPVHRIKQSPRALACIRRARTNSF